MAPYTEAEWHVYSVEENVWGPCGICGETMHSDDEVGEFAKPDGQHVLAHSQCGLDAGYSIA